MKMEYVSKWVFGKSFAALSQDELWQQRFRILFLVDILLLEPNGNKVIKFARAGLLRGKLSQRRRSKWSAFR